MSKDTQNTDIMENVELDDVKESTLVTADDSNISAKLHLFNTPSPGENVDFNEDGKVDYKDHALLSFVKIALSAFSGITLIAALVFVILANSFISFPPLVFNNASSTVNVPNYSANSVCFASPSVDHDLSNDEDFGGTKSELEANTVLSAIGNSDTATVTTLGSENSDDESTFKAGEDNVFADRSKIITLNNQGKDTSLVGSVFENTDEVPFAISGVKTSRTADGDLQGLAASKCVQPTTDYWFIGGNTNVQTATKLILANPSESATQVKITVWGNDNSAGVADDGSLKYAASRYEGINANTEKTILLSSGAPNQKVLAVHVETSSNPFSAIISTQSISGLTPNGVEFINATELTKSALIPEFTVLADDKSINTLDLLAPTANDETEVIAEFTNVETKKQTTKNVKVSKGVVESSELSDLGAGKYSVTLLSDTEFLGTIEQKVKYDDGAIDVAFYNPAELASSAFLPLNGATEINVYRNDDDNLDGHKVKEIRVRTFDSNGKTITAKTLDIKANSVMPIPHEFLDSAAFVYVETLFDSNNASENGELPTLTQNANRLTPVLGVSETWREEKGTSNITANILHTRSTDFTFAFNNIG